MAFKHNIKQFSIRLNSNRVLKEDIRIELKSPETNKAIVKFSIQNSVY